MGNFQRDARAALVSLRANFPRKKTGARGNMGLFSELPGSKGGAKYYAELGFDPYGFTAEEKHSICSYYDYFYANDNHETKIEPIGKIDFDEISYYKEFLPDVCFLWYDGQSNYAGMYYLGPLRGKVMFLCHDEPNHAPQFRNISSFLERVKSGDIKELSVPELGNSDYPADDLSANEKKQNLELAKHFLDSLPDMEDDDQQYQAALKAMYLMPAEHLDLLLPLVDTENMYIAQDLPDIFAYHRYAAAIPALRQAAESGRVPIRGAAKRALEKLRKDGRGFPRS
jgi:hypothetical protein